MEEAARPCYSVGPRDLTGKEIEFTKEHSLRWDDRGYFCWYRLKPKAWIKKKILK